MIKLPDIPNLPAVADPNFHFHLNRLLSDINRQLNELSGGRVSASVALDAPPSSGLWGLGDEVRNSSPVELGTAGSKYIVRGWLCVSAGEPGTWKEQRFLTGG